MAISSKPSSDAVYYEAGSPENTADMIAAQDRARANQSLPSTTKSWAPWLIGGLLVGGAAYLLLRD